MSNFILQIGIEYKTRDGLKAHVTGYDSAYPCPFMGNIPNERVASWNHNGFYNKDNRPSKFDIVGYWNEAANKTINA